MDQQQNKFIYLDHNATTPVDRRVLEVMLPYFTEIYGNAASIDHEAGTIAKRAVDHARIQCAKVINARAEEIIFTSGATESDNIALFGVAERYSDKGNHIITCVTEHSAVLDCCRQLERLGKQITYLPVDQYGMVDPNDVRRAITPRTIMVSLMFANNEVGTLHPIAEIGKIAREHDIIFHTDAAQAVGHVPIDVEAMNIDLMSISAHKVYGPKGIGALYIRSRRPRINPAPILYGGGHERGFRSGTLNVPGIVGMGSALALARKELHKDAEYQRNLTYQMLNKLQEAIDDIFLNGHPTSRLPHNLNISLKHVESKSLIVNLKDIAVSTGSACTTAMARTEPSHVVMALGFGEERAHSAIRIGVGRETEEMDIEVACGQIITVVRRLRRLVV